MRTVMMNECQVAVAVEMTTVAAAKLSRFCEIVVFVTLRSSTIRELPVESHIASVAHARVLRILAHK